MHKKWKCIGSRHTNEPQLIMRPHILVPFINNPSDLRIRWCGCDVHTCYCYQSVNYNFIAWPMLLWEANSSLFLTFYFRNLSPYFKGVKVLLNQMPSGIFLLHTTFCPKTSSGVCSDLVCDLTADPY